MGIPAFQYMNLAAGATTTGGAIGPLTADYVEDFSATVITTGTLTGAFRFYRSNDPRARSDNADRANAKWQEFTADVSAMISNPAGSTTQFTVDVSDFRSDYLRIDYTHTSGSGTVQIYLTCN